jgi:hypothetical protein
MMMDMRAVAALGRHGVVAALLLLLAVWDVEETVSAGEHTCAHRQIFTSEHQGMVPRRLGGAVMRLCLRGGGGDADSEQRDSSGMLDDSEMEESAEKTSSLHASLLDLDMNDSKEPATDPALIAERYWALPGTSVI